MKEKHYNQHPSGIECIDVVKHFDFCIGNVIKYVWRCGLKVHDNEDAKQAEIRDLLKARDYLDYKIAMMRDSECKETVSDDDLCDLDSRDWITHEIESLIERRMAASFTALEMAVFNHTHPDLVPKTDDICDEKQS